MTVGDINSGKSVLVDKICQASKTKNLIPGHHLSGCCLEYRYFDVRDEETDGKRDRYCVSGACVIVSSSCQRQVIITGEVLTVAIISTCTPYMALLCHPSCTVMITSQDKTRLTCVPSSLASRTQELLDFIA